MSNLSVYNEPCFSEVTSKTSASLKSDTPLPDFHSVAETVKAKKLEKKQKEKEALERQEEQARQNEELIKQQEKENEYFISDIPLDKSLQEYTYDLCCANDMSYELALAVMYCESKFDFDAIYYNDNGSYDSGIMQINSCNIEYLSEVYGIDDLTNPYDNIYAGINIISENIEALGENDALMVYNMGLGGYYSAVNSGIYQTEYSCDVLDKKEEIEAMPRG